MRKVVVFPRRWGRGVRKFSAPHFKRGVSDGHKIAELAGNAVGANDDGRSAVSSAEVSETSDGDWRDDSRFWVLAGR